MSSRFFDARELFYIQPNFWSAEECWQLRQLSGFGSMEFAGVYAGGRIQVDPDYRQTTRIVLTEGLHQEMERSIWTIKPQLEEHFRVPLNELSGSQLLRYGPGDYFRVHQDEGRIPSPGTRKVSIVLFLNSRDSFEGGDIVFYEKGENRTDNGHVFAAEEGLLLAFSPYLFHEVQEVTKGIRYSVVTWFL